MPIIPFETAVDAFRRLTRLTQAYGAPSYLTGIKAHRADDFTLTYSVDGFGIGIDIPIRKGEEHRLKELFIRMNELVLQAGGRVYLAKDETLIPDHFRRMFPRWREFLAIKEKYDPERMFQSDLYRRLFLGEDGRAFKTVGPSHGFVMSNIGPR